MPKSKMDACENCSEWKDKGYNFCPVCGLFIGVRKFNVKQEPDIINGIGSSRDTIEYHPAYAQMSFSRVQTHKSDSNTLYGSAIRHQGMVTMRIYPSEKHWDNYTESYFSSNKPYIEVDMSQAQFAEAITTMNMGGGVPVTLRSLRGQIMPNCSELTVQEKTQRNLNSQLYKFANTLVSYQKRADELLNQKGTLKSSDKKEISSMIDHILSDVQSNLPFLTECLQEVLDKNTLAAKQDIEAFMLHAVTVAGLNYIKDNNISLDFNGQEQLTEK